MSRFRIIACACLAAFALSAVAASSASAALPEFSVIHVKFSTKGGAAKLSAAGEVVSCTESESKEAEITAAKKVAKVTIHFKGCKKGTETCQSAKVAGEIVTKTVNGEIGYIEKATKKVGTELKPPNAGEEFVKFKCGGGIETKVTGCALGENTPVNVLATEGKLIYREAGGKQQFTKFEGGGACELKAFGFIGAVEVTESTITTEVADEIKA
jgi:hypothetical protein